MWTAYGRATARGRGGSRARGWATAAVIGLGLVTSLVPGTAARAQTAAPVGTPADVGTGSADPPMILSPRSRLAPTPRTDGVTAAFRTLSFDVGQEKADPLMPGDKIRLEFWREPALSGDYVVDEAGRVVLPILGSMDVTGRPAPELKRRLLEAYDEQLRNQDVQIVLLRRVRVLGAVKEPGLYHADPTMTLADVVALAGGSEGRLKGIKLQRDGRTIQSDLKGETPVAERLRSGDQILVPEKRWLARYAPIIVGGLISGAALVLSQTL